MECKIKGPRVHVCRQISKVSAGAVQAEVSVTLRMLRKLDTFHRNNRSLAGGSSKMTGRQNSYG